MPRSLPGEVSRDERPQPSLLALKLHGFFIDYLPRERALSPHTLLSYRDSIKLLLRFTAGEKGDPSRLAVEALTVEKISAFLQSLETGRCNTASTRKIAHSSFEEIEAVFAAVDTKGPSGQRDLALLSLMFNIGARVSEIVGLQTEDLCLSAPFSVLLRGKGRKERTCPIWPETASLANVHRATGIFACSLRAVVPQRTRRLIDPVRHTRNPPVATGDDLAREASEGQRATKRGYHRFLRCSFLFCNIVIMNVLKFGLARFELATS